MSMTQTQVIDSLIELLREALELLQRLDRQ